MDSFDDGEWDPLGHHFDADDETAAHGGWDGEMSDVEVPPIPPPPAHLSPTSEGAQIRRSSFGGLVRCAGLRRVEGLG